MDNVDPHILQSLGLNHDYHHEISSKIRLTGLEWDHNCWRCSSSREIRESNLTDSNAWPDLWKQAFEIDIIVVVDDVDTTPYFPWFQSRPVRCHGIHYRLMDGMWIVMVMDRKSRDGRQMGDQMDEFIVGDVEIINIQGNQEMRSRRLRSRSSRIDLTLMDEKSWHFRCEISNVDGLQWFPSWPLLCWP